MPARTTREEARERVIKAFMSSLDKVIPADEAEPLRGVDVPGVGGAGVGVEACGDPDAAGGACGAGGERAGGGGGPLPALRVGGRVPGEAGDEPGGARPRRAGVAAQAARRCRDCGGSFSPSGAGLGAAVGGAADAAGGGAVGAGGGGEGVRPRRPRA